MRFRSMSDTGSWTSFHRELSTLICGVGTVSTAVAEGICRADGASHDAGIVEKPAGGSAALLQSLPVAKLLGFRDTGSLVRVQGE